MLLSLAVRGDSAMPVGHVVAEDDGAAGCVCVAILHRMRVSLIHAV